MLLAMAAGAYLPWANRAAATTYYWGVGDGNWSTGTNWLPNGVPADVDDVNIVESDNVARTITYDYTGPAVTLNTLTIDLTGGSNFATLSIAANNLTSNYEEVGYNGNGAVNQSGGTNTVTELDLGYLSASTGTYTLGTGATLSSSSETVGVGGNGTFYQTGGTNTPGGLVLGRYMAASAATYILEVGATLSSADELIGDYGNGIFNQTGGTNTVTGGLVIAEGRNGVYSLSGVGALSVVGNENIGEGSGGNGTFNQTGGTENALDAGLFLGYNSGSAGTYVLGAGAALSGFGGEVVGYSGNGIFDQTGGTNTVAGGLDLGFNSGSAGA